MFRNKIYTRRRRQTNYALTSSDPQCFEENTTNEKQKQKEFKSRIIGHLFKTYKCALTEAVMM
ncbi:hypothetical protein DPMN_184917 [Dreissena polymorpha]|uniref:Uncharacterized protein n=1 Tax=Dreissena polymorpha TaxID=45954 RepID=A0A9D4DJK3_DREPO|nr:hypothetical protein DPMN_184917 [Dreissena polymorpha]